MEEFDSWVLLLYKITVHRQSALISLFNSQPSRLFTYFQFKSCVWQRGSAERRVDESCDWNVLPDIWILERRPAPGKGGVPLRVEFGPGAPSPLQIKNVILLDLANSWTCSKCRVGTGFGKRGHQEFISTVFQFSALIFVFLPFTLQ